MALVIYDQGYRIQTPVDSLFRQRGVEAMSASQANAAVPGSDDPVRQQQDLEKRIELSRERFEAPQQSSSGYKTYQKSGATPSTPQRPVLKAAQIMSSPVLTTPLETSLRQAWELMRTHEVSHLVVIDGEQRALGLLSREDVIRHGTDSPISISQAYHKQMVVASPDTPVTSLAASFVRYAITAVPVISAEDKLQGIVCRTDLIRILINEEGLDRWA
ncbi:CBS domain-containing protein [Marinobacterium sediminicola]|uniref:CBS domain-containing protein n=1 Tax=Marinobacterium sediminicola TaxID=518898 RepID=A0ABY1RY79_9GAMM|nr:CBS domain-containing protein [Marinobacterium sediminicola]ULG68733.1 CBS domain-containing protein [Marinobacterium sediminicola]SMR73259.1 CBS domain-containing protein [Marinobacterium sediminicola]